MKIKVLEIKDGVAIGYLDGKLYKGTPTYVGFDELEHEVSVSPDGKTINTIVKCGDEVHGKGQYDYDSFIEQHIAELAKVNIPDEIAKATAEDRWEEMKNPKKTPKQTTSLTVPTKWKDLSDEKTLEKYTDLFSDNNLIPIRISSGEKRTVELEKKIKTYTWLPL